MTDVDEIFLYSSIFCTRKKLSKMYMKYFNALYKIDTCRYKIDVVIRCYTKLTDVNER